MFKITFCPRHGSVFQSYFACGTYIIRPADYTAPTNPCRDQDRYCSIKCTVLKLHGTFNCSFCVCNDKENYVKWDTTPASQMSTQIPTTLAPDHIKANNIEYHKVSDPCDLALDGTCPVKCTEVAINRSGTKCTQCDCHGSAVLFG
ncbi:uncharacterized protein LOC128222170 isoform X2 [Mya arenaria]|uniref:uncharacterized protein LOC128222170 isoform X2 n=1 Tax=Mya arenaria TaxID=6604 RepID=UPI0022DF0E2E|nr:uncharacterized protein LOC128222170 isoform X2 [Mya arenaria]